MLAICQLKKLIERAETTQIFEHRQKHMTIGQSGIAQVRSPDLRPEIGGRVEI
jgi:hypothetical protein